MCLLSSALTFAQSWFSKIFAMAARVLSCVLVLDNVEEKTQRRTHAYKHGRTYVRIHTRFFLSLG